MSYILIPYSNLPICGDTEVIAKAHQLFLNACLQIVIDSTKY